MPQISRKKEKRKVGDYFSQKTMLTIPYATPYPKKAIRLPNTKTCSKKERYFILSGNAKEVLL